MRVQAAKRVCFWNRRDKTSPFWMHTSMLAVVCHLRLKHMNCYTQISTHKMLIFIRAHWYNLHIALLVSGNSLSFIYCIEIQHMQWEEENQKHKFIIINFFCDLKKKNHRKDNNTRGIVMHRQHKITLRCGVYYSLGLCLEQPHTGLDITLFSSS